VLLGCRFDTSNEGQGGGGGGPDADTGQADADPTDPDAGSTEKRHLLLSEVQAIGTGDEFIEIYNPTDATISLSEYYLADTKEYALVPGNYGFGPKPMVTNNDFIARFPDGASIDSHNAQVIAIRPSDFNATYGLNPDYRIGGTGTGRVMENAHPSSIGSLASLTDSGEGIALFVWDGETDLVTDVDQVNAGMGTTLANALPNKTGSQVDGPVESAYRTDLATMPPMLAQTQAGQSYTRIAPEQENEIHNDFGNGLFGHDESTEDISTTWAIAAASPGQQAAGL